MSLKIGLFGGNSCQIEHFKNFPMALQNLKKVLIAPEIKKHHSFIEIQLEMAKKRQMGLFRGHFE
jgi:hypothetical protein